MQPTVTLTVATTEIVDEAEAAVEEGVEAEEEGAVEVDAAMVDAAVTATATGIGTRNSKPRSTKPHRRHLSSPSSCSSACGHGGEPVVVVGCLHPQISPSFGIICFVSQKLGN